MGYFVTAWSILKDKISFRFMNKEYLIELLNKYLNGEASEDEIDLLISHYNVFELEPDIMNSLTPRRKLEIKVEMESKILDAISLNEEANSNLQSGIRNRSWISIAAVLTVIFSTGLFFFFKTSEQQKQNTQELSETIENRLIQLPDGSTVIISPGSRLSYPSTFDGLSKRKVYLDGQAYFDIKHNPHKPFIIHTDKLKTTVLGTAFVINAWADDPDIEVTVSRGRVKVEDQFNKTIGVITRNEQITYNKMSERVIQKVVNAPEYLQWKEQDLLLTDVTVAEASKLLEERFNVKIVISDDHIKSKRFTTNFQKGVILEKILHSLAEFNDAEYSYDKSKAEVVIRSRLEKTITNK